MPVESGEPAAIPDMSDRKPPFRVLIVDDNAEVLRSLTLVLEGAGYAVEGTANATSAMAAHRREPADVLLTDIFMPDTDGLECMRMFRKQWPAVRIIAMSGGGTVVRGNYLQSAEFAGADGVLQKPFDPLVLLEMLGELLKKA